MSRNSSRTKVFEGAPGEEHPHLGRQRLSGVPRQERARAPGGGGSGAGLRLSVAALRRGLPGHARGLLGPGGGPVGGSD